jgi:hypothetical protein
MRARRQLDEGLRRGAGFEQEVGDQRQNKLAFRSISRRRGHWRQRRARGAKDLWRRRGELAREQQLETASRPPRHRRSRLTRTAQLEPVGFGGG